MLETLIEDRIDCTKPRHDGITYIIDKFQGLDKENFETISPYIDMVKRYGAFPLLLKQQSLINRIDFYHQSNVLVLQGGLADRIRDT